jgi:hydroxyacylglutathione hydrolase
MEIKQFEDKNLAHYSYAIFSNGEVALIDPSRDPRPYYDFAKQRNARITAVIETHPHADFVSSHLEIHNTTGATIYVSKLLGAEYEHQSFDDGDAIVLGSVTLKAVNTPGHSPDSIIIIAIDVKGKPQAVFTGDTLFIGDCGRPDLREQAGAITASRADLAKQMYHSLRNNLITLPGDVVVYPAHGAGSLCGKGLGKQSSSTIALERKNNWSLQPMSEADFVKELLTDQPFVPKYFPFDVSINKKGAIDFSVAISNVPKRKPVDCADCASSLKQELVIVDTRSEKEFKKRHLPNAINLMADGKFETWLGAIINPGEKFYIVAANDIALNEVIQRTARIGYETQIELAFVSNFGNDDVQYADTEELLDNEGAFTIVDVRNVPEAKEKKIFKNALNIPLPDLRDHVNEIPVAKPIVVHCAGGYRSAAASSMIKSALKKRDSDQQVFDLSEAVKTL